MSAHLLFRFGKTSKRIPIPEDRPFRVGRVGPGIDLRVNEPSISRRHAEIEKRESARVPSMIPGCLELVIIFLKDRLDGQGL